MRTPYGASKFALGLLGSLAFNNAILFGGERKTCLACVREKLVCGVNDEIKVNNLPRMCS